MLRAYFNLLVKFTAIFGIVYLGLNHFYGANGGKVHMLGYDLFMYSMIYLLTDLVTKGVEHAAAMSLMRTWAIILLTLTMPAQFLPAFHGLTAALSILLCLFVQFRFGNKIAEPKDEDFTD